MSVSPDPGFDAALETVDALRVRDMRAIFATMRRWEHDITADALLPAYGLTVGEFSTAYVLNQHRHRRGPGHVTPRKN